MSKLIVFLTPVALVIGAIAFSSGALSSTGAFAGASCEEDWDDAGDDDDDADEVDDSDCDEAGNRDDDDGDDDTGEDETLTGATREQAVQAALAHTGGGTVTDTEAGDDGAVYSVEIRLANGTEVEIGLDAGFNVISQEADD
jgi:uncharacterized membrane protein YkoI